jgi:hypothetical protein
MCHIRTASALAVLCLSQPSPHRRSGSSAFALVPFAAGNLPAPGRCSTSKSLQSRCPPRPSGSHQVPATALASPRRQLPSSIFDSYQRMNRLHIVPMIGGIKLQDLQADHLGLCATPAMSRHRTTIATESRQHLPRGGRHSRQAARLQSCLHQMFHVCILLRTSVRRSLLRPIELAASVVRVARLSSSTTWTKTDQMPTRCMQHEYAVLGRHLGHPTS